MRRIDNLKEKKDEKEAQERMKLDIFLRQEKELEQLKKEVEDLKSQLRREE